MDDKTFKLIEHLHALTEEGSGATEAEAQTALKKMQQLLFKHNLTLHQILQDKAKRGERVDPPNFIQKVVDLRMGRVMGRDWKYTTGKTNLGEREWRTKLAFAVADYNFCRGLKTKNCEWFYFYGTSENIEAVIEIWTYICEQAQDLSYQALKQFRKMPESTKILRQDFLTGLVARVRSRLYAQWKELQNETEMTKALVLVSDTALTEFVDKFKSKRSSGYTPRGRSAGYSMGQAAGDRINLNRPRKELN